LILIIDTYENEDRKPILSHTFRGRSEKEVLGVVRAHMKTDSFFRASLTTQRFRGIPLRTKQRWVR
jgi:hypothetical protein